MRTAQAEAQHAVEQRAQQERKAAADAAQRAAAAEAERQRQQAFAQQVRAVVLPFPPAKLRATCGCSMAHCEELCNPEYTTCVSDMAGRS